MTSNRIVVGVDGSVGARSALLWAADECAVRGQLLTIVHAPDAADADSVASIGEPRLRALDELGERMLSEHAAAASARQPSVPVITMLSHASAADALIELSLDSSLIVVGTRGRSGIVTSILGSVSHRVAAHAHCPVAVVPEQPARRRDVVAQRVVAGVSATQSGRLALEFAFEEAQRRGAVLVTVRAWGEPDDAPEAVSIDREKARAADLLRRDLEPFTARYPDVTTEPMLVTAEPSDALLRAASNAQLVVVGCHHSEDRWSTRLGPVPSAILHRAACPVVVVGECRAEPAAGGRGNALVMHLS